MPYAKRRKNEYLNKAYAHVCSGSWEKAKDSICKGLISMGFEKEESKAYTYSANPKDNDSRENAACITDEDFSVPQLLIPDEEDYNSGWSLSDCDTTKIEIEFDEKTKQCVIDIDNKKVTTQFLDKNNQLSFDLDITLPTKNECSMLYKKLSSWLDKELQMEQVKQDVLLRFIELAIENLLKRKNLDIVKLYNGRLALKILLSSKIKKHRDEFYKKKFQEIKSKITINADKFIFDKDNYPAKYHEEKQEKRNRCKFNKHYYTLTSDMNKEEEECAIAMDQNENVKFWIRNLDRNGFWLPKERGKFYPDFIAKLKDDRILIVEYKGEHLVENDDTKQKESIGELWAEKTGNLFLLGVKEDSDGKNIEFQIKSFLSKSIN
jgi:type III restriction enzyme